MKSILCAILLILLLSGCETEQTSHHQPQQQTATPKSFVPDAERPHIVHTFEILPYTGGNLAIDRATGQKCRTWDWACGCYTTIMEAFNKRTAKLAVSSDAYLRLALQRDRQLDQCNDRSMYGMRCDIIGTLPTCDSLRKGTE